MQQASSSASSLWLAANPSKRWAEVFFLAYSPFWILWALCILVPFQLYEVTWYIHLQHCSSSSSVHCQCGAQLSNDRVGQ